MKYRVTIETPNSDRAPTEYIGKWRGVDAAIFGAMRKHVFAEKIGRWFDGQVVVTVEEMRCNVSYSTPPMRAVTANCELQHGHGGRHFGHMKRGTVWW